MTEYPFRTPFIYWIEDPFFKIYSKVDEWCYATFDDWLREGNVETIEYCFKSESDLTLFLLRWPNLHYMDKFGNKIGNW